MKVSVSLKKQKQKKHNDHHYIVCNKRYQYYKKQ